MTASKIMLAVTVLGFSAVMVLIAMSCSSVYQIAQKEMAELRQRPSNIPPGVITEADIQHLPEPVQRYLRYTGIIGKERIHSVRLKQEGLFRMEPDKKWKSFEAEEYYTIDQPSFLWYAKIKAFPILSLTVRDTYRDGHGNILAKITPLVKLLDQRGPKIDQGTMLRYLQEMIWFPTAFLHDNITWEAIDEMSAKVTITDHDQQVSGIFYFNEQGQVINFEADRYMDETMERWSTPMTKYEEFHGLKLPVEGEGIWKLQSGDFSYITVKITAIEYNTLEMY